MSDYYLGEIRMFLGSYAPEDFHLCDGTLLPVSSNQVLFSLIGTIYGGDGVNTFGLPDLRGRVPIGQGHGTNLSDRVLAQKGGEETVALTQATIPAHNHVFNTLATPATTGTLAPDSPATAASKTLTYAQGVNGVRSYLNDAAPTPTVAALQAASVTPSGGGSLPHQNMMPSFVVNFIICTTGLYPDRP